MPTTAHLMTKQDGTMSLQFAATGLDLDYLFEIANRNERDPYVHAEEVTFGLLVLDPSRRPNSVETLVPQWRIKETEAFRKESVRNFTRDIAKIDEVQDVRGWRISTPDGMLLFVMPAEANETDVVGFLKALDVDVREVWRGNGGDFYPVFQTDSHDVRIVRRSDAQPEPAEEPEPAPEPEKPKSRIPMPGSAWGMPRM